MRCGVAALGLLKSSLVYRPPERHLVLRGQTVLLLYAVGLVRKKLVVNKKIRTHRVPRRREQQVAGGSETNGRYPIRRRIVKQHLVFARASRHATADPLPRVSTVQARSSW